jgi:hypothetical protein
VKITDEQLKALEQEFNGKIRLFQDANEPPEWQVVLRKPNGKEAQNFRLTANHDGRKAYAALDVVKATVVWPSSEEFRALLDENPFMPEGITADSAWKKWVGLEVAESQKK